MSDFERQYLFDGVTFYGRSEMTPEQEMLKNDIAKLEKDMESRKRQNYSKDENRQYYEDRLYAIEEKFFLRNQAVAEGLREELEKKKKAYIAERKKNAAEDLVELMRLQLQYSAMSDDELTDQAQEYIRSPGPEWGLDKLQTLNAELRKRGIDKIGYGSRETTPEGNQAGGPVREQTFGEWIRETQGDQPWILENPELMRALRLYDSPFGTFAGLFDDGNIVDGLEIEKVIEH